VPTAQPPFKCIDTVQIPYEYDIGGVFVRLVVFSSFTVFFKNKKNKKNNIVSRISTTLSAGQGANHSQRVSLSLSLSLSVRLFGEAHAVEQYQLARVLLRYLSAFH
jgi:hypothetical protein